LLRSPLECKLRHSLENTSPRNLSLYRFVTRAQLLLSEGLLLSSDLEEWIDLRTQGSRRKSGCCKTESTGEVDIPSKIALKRASRTELVLDVQSRNIAKLSDCTELTSKLVLLQAWDCELGLLLKSSLATEQIGSHTRQSPLALVL
jgi:hypothetical protein